ncbi:hypothetical protein A5906_07370 [Bradyrhizobium sacchari]|nr:hypothetical protein A5906_07370 [Bradyrhizobium sacchari]
MRCHHRFDACGHSSAIDAPLVQLQERIGDNVVARAPREVSRRQTGAEFGAGIKYAVEHDWLELHESGTYVRLKKAGEDLLATAAK